MAKVRKQFILDANKIKRVKRILKAHTDTEAVNDALDIVLANQKIAELHHRLAGRLKIKDMDQSHFHE